MHSSKNIYYDAHLVTGTIHSIYTKLKAVQTMGLTLVTLGLTDDRKGLCTFERVWHHDERMYTWRVNGYPGGPGDFNKKRCERVCELLNS